MSQVKRFKGVLRAGLFGTLLFCVLGYAAAVGDYSSHVQNGNQIDFTVANGKVRIYVCTPTIFRVSFDTRGTGTFTSNKDVLGMTDVNRTWTAVAPLTVADASTTINITTSAMVIKVQKSPFRVSFYNTDGTTLLVGDAAGMNSSGASSTAPAFTFTQGTNEHFFGWGNAFEAFRRSPGYHPMDIRSEQRLYLCGVYFSVVGASRRLCVESYRPWRSI